MIYAMAINSLVFTILGLTIAVSILFFTNQFVFLSLAELFQLHDIASKYVLGIALCLLTLSFFLSSVLAYKYENWLTKGYYFFSGLWLGVLTNLVVGFAFAWGAAEFFEYVGWETPKFLFGALGLMFAIAYSAYGIWNAYRPIVKYLSVKIKDLPQEWKGQTIVQISDVHLGNILGYDFLCDIVQKINKLRPKAVFITGDLFDGMDFNLDVSIKPLDKILAPSGTFYITGNHETYLGVQRTFNIIKNTKTRILDDMMAVEDGLQIVGISYPERGKKKDLHKAISGIQDYDSTKPTILLFHDPVQISKVKQIGVNLMLAGHTHKGQLFPLGWITKILYKGYDYGLKQEGDFSIFTSCGVGSWGPTMRTGNRPEIVAITLN